MESSFVFLVLLFSGIALFMYQMRKMRFYKIEGAFNENIINKILREISTRSNWKINYHDNYLLKATRMNNFSCISGQSLTIMQKENQIWINCIGLPNSIDNLFSSRKQRLIVKDFSCLIRENQF